MTRVFLARIICFPGGWRRAALREHGPALLGGALVLIWILTTPRYLQLAEYSFLGRPFSSSLAAQVGAVPVGLGMLFTPSALSIDYGIPLPSRISDTMALLGLALYLAAAAGVLRYLRRSRAVAVGLALWLAALLPTQSFVPKLDALSNRPLGLALAGLLLVVAPSIAALTNRLRTGARVRWRAAALASALGCCAVLTVATTERASLFQTELALWRDAASKSLTNERPLVQYAVILKRERQHVAALTAIRAAQRINPFNSQVAVLAAAFEAPEVSK